MVREWEQRWDDWSEDQFSAFAELKVDTQVVSRTDTLAEIIGPEDYILDIGCGAGRYHRSLIEQRKLAPASNYIGLDRTRGMLDEASVRYPEAFFCIGDAFNLPFSDNSFEICLSMDVLQHIPDYRRLVEEMYRVCGKYMIFVTWWTHGEEENRAEYPKISKLINFERFVGFIKTFPNKKILYKNEIILVEKLLIPDA